MTALTRFSGRVLPLRVTMPSKRGFSLLYLREYVGGVFYC